MVFEVAKIAREAKVKLPDLITRPVGRSVYARMREKLSLAGAGETIVLDFDGIKVIDSSFIDEFLVKLIMDAAESDFFIKLRNISAISEINIDSVFVSYSNYKNGRIALVRDELGRNSKYYIGPLTEQESDILGYLKINQHAGIGEISKYCGLEVEALEGILAGMSRLRVVRKIGGEFASV